jgi:hypothetical protein
MFFYSLHRRSDDFIVRAGIWVMTGITILFEQEKALF